MIIIVRHLLQQLAPDSVWSECLSLIKSYLFRKRQRKRKSITFLHSSSYSVCSPARLASFADISVLKDSVGTIAVYTCWVGFYFIEGSSTRTAVCVNGIWQNKIADCRRTYADKHRAIRAFCILSIPLSSRAFSFASRDSD